MQSICNNWWHIATVLAFLQFDLSSLQSAAGKGYRNAILLFIAVNAIAKNNNNKRNNRGKHNNKLPHKLYANRSTQQQRAANSIGQLQQPAAAAAVVVAAASRASPELAAVAGPPAPLPGLYDCFPLSDLWSVAD